MDEWVVGYIAGLAGAMASVWYLVKFKKWRFEPPNEFRYQCHDEDCSFSCSGTDAKLVDKIASSHEETHKW